MNYKQNKNDNKYRKVPKISPSMYKSYPPPPPTILL